MEKSKSKSDQMKSETLRRSKFFHGLTADRYTVFNWSLYSSLTIVLLVVILSKWNTTVKSLVKSFLVTARVEIIGIAVGAIGTILAAIAILIVIYSKDSLNKIVKADDCTFEGFLFPYRYTATIWGILAIVSIMSAILVFPFSINKIFIDIGYFAWLFLLIYSILSTLYLIGEVIQNIFLAAMINK